NLSPRTTSSVDFRGLDPRTHPTLPSMLRVLLDWPGQARPCHRGCAPPRSSCCASNEGIHLPAFAGMTAGELRSSVLSTVHRLAQPTRPRGLFCAPELSTPL